MAVSSSDRGDASPRLSTQMSRALRRDCVDFFVARGCDGAPIPVVTYTRSTVAPKTRLVAIGVLALFALVGCSGSKSTSAPAAAASSRSAPGTTTDPTTTLPATPSPTTASPGNQLVVAVRAFWNLYLELGARTGTFNAVETRERLAQRTSGSELTKLSGVFQGNAAAGLVVKGTIDVAPKILSIAGTTALVQDCYDDSTGLYRAKDGKRLDVDDPRRHKVLMTFTLANDTWKVSAIKDEGLGCTA
jgi:hypothetical protein